MLIPKGYKQTEIGIIPEEWQVKKFYICFNFLSNNTFSRKNLNFIKGSIKNIHYGDILTKFSNIINIKKEKLPFINEDIIIRNTETFVNNGDIIFADTAEDYTVGKAIEVVGIENQKVVSGLHTIHCRLTNLVNFSSGWLGYYLNSKYYHDQLLPYITGIKVSSISKSSIKKTSILLPPLKEQANIVKIISDMDSLIFSIQNLINKKKAIRQGAIQELLTGKRRLPGFNGKWVKKRLENFIFIQNGYSFNSETFSDIGVNVIRISDINNKIINCKKTVKYDGVINPNFCVHKNDILIAMSGATVGKVGVYMDNKISYINQRVGKVVLKGNNINTYFLFNFFCSKIFEKILGEIITAGAQPNISGKQIEDIYLKIPQVREQEAIANILSDMDDEIKKLEIKLQKYKKIKQGMMQQLLTGRIRLLD